MPRYEIKKSEILGCWLIWEIYKNYWVDIFHSKYKKDCINKLKEMGRDYVKNNSKR